MPETPDSLATLQRRLAYTFRDLSLLERAVTHPSYLQEHPTTPDSYQRLEFLGDAVLQFILTESLFQLFPADREGSLSKRRSTLSQGRFLTQLALDLGLHHCLRISASEEQTGGRLRASTLEDALEATLGAIYVDSDLSTARRVLLDVLGSLPERLAALQPADNPKGQLQEIVQPKHGNFALRYAVTHVAGGDHEREYEATVHLLDRVLGQGRGSSKKIAEEAAARAALVELQTQQIHPEL